MGLFVTIAIFAFALLFLIRIVLPPRMIRREEKESPSMLECWMQENG
jgi:hypothetical protein